MNETETAVIKECACDKCKAMCKKPCTPTPEEFEKLIKKYPDGFMMDYTFLDLFSQTFLADREDDNKIRGNRPFMRMASKECVNKLRTINAHLVSNCVFQNEQGLCEIYEDRPMDAKLAIHGEDREEGLKRFYVLQDAWNTGPAMALMMTWATKHNIENVNWEDKA